MNHLGDANKMVETPRTDELLTAMLMLDIYGYVQQGNCPQQWVNYARELERELNAANDRIKRLEDAVEAYRTAYTPDGHVAPHDCFATGPKTGDPIQDLIACPGCWAERKAKEAKLGSGFDKKWFTDADIEDIIGDCHGDNNSKL